MMKKLFFALAFLTTNAFAWGPTGHRVVGEVAEKRLDVNVWAKIYKISKGQSLAKLSTWADEIKSEPETYSHTFNWHYTTWPSDVHDHSGEAENMSTGFLLKSIEDQVNVLKSETATDEQKLFALRFLVHLVGDVHMPFHVGNGTDRGGNFCKVTFHGEETNLHALWDEGMIDFTRLSFTEMTSFVSQGHSIEELLTYKKGTVVDWAKESKAILATAYPADVTPSTEPMSILKYCQKEVLPEDKPKLGFEYSYKFMPVVEKRLFQAGVRLAVLLNSALK